MSALIEIRKELIGTENTNSVDARELHTNLEVKKKFADWIKTQINTLNLDENIDYLTVPLKGNGGRFASKDYIITLDTAKHISMASRTEKGKEVRKYFIEAEKKLTQLQPQQNDLEEITNKLKGIDFLVNGMMYLNNYDEDSYTSGVLMLSDTIRNIICDVKKLEEIA